MPGNGRGNLTDLKDLYVVAASELKDAGVYYQVAIHVITSIKSNVDEAIKAGKYDIELTPSGSD